jgi:hypothetical protein
MSRRTVRSDLTGARKRGSAAAETGAAAALEDVRAQLRALEGHLDLSKAAAREYRMALRQMLSAITGSNPTVEELRALVDMLVPEAAVPQPAQLLQARRNAEARVELLHEFGAYTATQLAEVAGSSARNPSALAGRWRAEGKVLGLTHHGQTYYPAFQFDDDGRPLPVIRSVRRVLGERGFTEWQSALWLTSAHGRLAGGRPVDLLVKEPGRVVALAESEAQELVG